MLWHIRISFLFEAEQCSIVYHILLLHSSVGEVKVFYSVDHMELWKILRDGNIRPPDLPPEKSV